MDYQPAVLGGLGDHDHLLTLASGAIGLARQAGITIAYLRVTFADQDYEQVLRRGSGWGMGMRPIWRTRSGRRSSAGR
jgi:hypothetical protein